MFTDRNGTQWRNLTEQVLKNKNDITRIIDGEITLAEFGIKVMNVSYGSPGPIPSEEPPIIPGDTSNYGYAWLVQRVEGTFDLWIWTRVETADPEVFIGMWVNLQEFPAPGPQGPTGQNGLDGAPGATGATGQRGSKITYSNTAPTGTLIPGDLWITLSYQLNMWTGTQWSLLGSMQGPQGVPGQNGADGLTPHIVDDYWVIGSTQTGVKAKGEDGASIEIQAGVYTVETLPTFASTTVGQAFVVETGTGQDLYFNGYGGTDWTIINDWGGIQGPPGPGLPTGGLTNQILMKNSTADFDYIWASVPQGVRIYNVTSSTATSGSVFNILLTVDAYSQGGDANSFNSSPIFGIRMPSSYSSSLVPTTVNVTLKYSATQQISFQLLARDIYGNDVGTEANPFIQWHHKVNEVILVSLPYLLSGQPMYMIDNSRAALKSVEPTLNTALATKQDVLVSGTNIKTINNESLLGSGNINITGGGGGATWTKKSVFIPTSSGLGKQDTIFANDPESIMIPLYNFTEPGYTGYGGPFMINVYLIQTPTFTSASRINRISGYHIVAKSGSTYTKVYSYTNHATNSLNWATMTMSFGPKYPNIAQHPYVGIAQGTLTNNGTIGGVGISSSFGTVDSIPILSGTTQYFLMPAMLLQDEARDWGYDLGVQIVNS